MSLQRLRRGLVTALACLGGLLLLVTVFPPRWYVRWLAGQWTDTPGAVLIVLGSDSVDAGIMGPSSYWRSVYALLVWREGGFRHLILSGSDPTTLPMRDFLACQGVPASSITLERRSQSTRENVLFTTEIARQFPGPYVLLTSDFHMRRAANGGGGNAGRLGRFSNYCPEQLYRTFGWGWSRFCDTCPLAGQDAVFGRAA